MSFEETKKKVHVTATHHLRPNSRLRKYAHNAIAIMLVAVLSVWQTPAGAFAEPSDDVDAALTEQVDETTTADAAGGDADGKATDEAADADGDEPQAADKKTDADIKAEKDEKTGDEEADKQEEKAEAPSSSATEEVKEPEPEKWVIAFDANGGEPVDGADTSGLESIEDSGEVKLPQGLFERADYEFAGWNTVADPSDENIEKEDKLFVPDGVGLEDLTYHYVELTEDNADEGELKDAVETSDGKKIAVVPNDEAKEAAEAAGKDADAKDAKGRTIEACDLRDVVEDGKLQLFAQWREKPKDVKVVAADEEDADKKDTVEAANEGADKANKDADAKVADEAKKPDEKDADKGDKAKNPEEKDADKDALSSADYSESDGVEAADVQGAAAKNRTAARKALKAAGVNDEQTDGVANELFAAGEGEGGGEGEGDDTPDEVPTHADGTEIESITAKWITSDTVDNDDADLLYIRPSGDTSQSVRMQINYSLSGEHNYDPGDIVITIPASMFKNRAGKDVGTITIPFPKDPSTRADFNWKKVGDTYVLTNTKRMSAATKGYIQFAISGMSPHDMVDMQVSKEFSANIQVTTHKGNTIAMGSNALTAQFDTQAEITDVVKRLYNSAQRVPASQVKIPEELKDQYADEDEFIVVNWYAWGNAVANTMYTVDYADARRGSGLHRWQGQRSHRGRRPLLHGERDDRRLHGRGQGQRLYGLQQWPYGWLHVLHHRISGKPVRARR